MKIQLSEHFSYGKRILVTLPSIGMMIFTSIYGVVDGFVFPALRELAVKHYVNYWSAILSGKV